MAVPEKVVVHGADARSRVFKGALKVTQPVKSTLGPYGVNALLEKQMKPTNDGVTIAREIQAQDEIEQLGVRKMQEIAQAIDDEVGDGTTTGCTLAQGILEEADRFLPTTKKIGSKKPSEISEQIERERKEVTEKLKEMATPITTEQQLIEVATVSVEDKELGEIIGKAQWEVGPDGVLIAEEVNERSCSYERVVGLMLDNGFSSQKLVNNHEKQAFEIKDVKIIYTNHTIEGLGQMKDKILQPLVENGFKDIIIMSRGFTNQAVTDCLENAKHGVNIYPLNAPYTDQAQVMEDLEAVLGGHFIDKDSDRLEDAELSDVGNVAFISAKRGATIITGNDDAAAKGRVASRIESLEKKLSGEKSEFEKKNITRRIAQLKNGFAVIKIGAPSIAERQYKKDKADDAVNAVRAALQEGVVPGAGLAFKTIADELPDDSILKKALLAPYQQIKQSAPPDFEIAEWVKDPVKVLRVALEKACSVSGMLSTVNIAIATQKEKPRYMQEVSQPESELDD